MAKSVCADCGLTVYVRDDGQLAPHLWNKKRPHGCPGGRQLTDEEIFENEEIDAMMEEHYNRTFDLT